MHTFTGKAVQGPDQDYIELALYRISENSLELGAVRLAAALVVDVFPGNFPLLGGGELLNMGKLVLCVLPAVRGADAGIDGRSHKLAPASSDPERVPGSIPAGTVAAQVRNASRVRSHLSLHFQCKSHTGPGLHP
jgi:hypothetical protein